MGAYRKNVPIAVGKLLSLSVDLHTAIPAKEYASSLHRICREHHGPIGNKNYCKEDGHEVAWGEWLTSGEIDGKVYAVDEQQVDKPSDERTEVFALQPVDAKELNDMTVERGATYYCKPSTAAQHELWTMLYRQAGKTNTALVTRGALRAGYEKLDRFKQFRGYLVMTELAFPDSISEPPESAPEVSVDKTNQELFRQVVENITTDVASLDTENERAKKLEEWLVTNGIVLDADTEAGEPSIAHQVKSLTDTLMEAVEAAKGEQ